MYITPNNSEIRTPQVEVGCEGKMYAVYFLPSQPPENQKEHVEKQSEGKNGKDMKEQQ